MAAPAYRPGGPPPDASPDVPLFELTPELIDAASIEERDHIVRDLEKQDLLRLPFDKIAIRFPMEKIADVFGIVPDDVPDTKTVLTMYVEGALHIKPCYATYKVTSDDEYRRGVTKEEMDAKVASGEAKIIPVVSPTVGSSTFYSATRSRSKKYDLNELEKTTQPPNPSEKLTTDNKYDPELDIETSPPPEGAVDSEGAESDPSFSSDTEEDTSGLTVDEVFPIDTNRNWVTVEFAYLANYAAQSGFSYYSGGGLRYGLTLGKMIFLDHPHVQDSFAIEGSFFLYKILNYLNAGDAYTVVPLMATARYTIQFGESFGFFLYGGLVKSIVTSAVASTGPGLDSLNSILPAVGAGFLFGIGPHWDLRMDLGLDTLGAGLVLRF